MALKVIVYNLLGFIQSHFQSFAKVLLSFLVENIIQKNFKINFLGAQNVENKDIDF